MSVQFYPNGIGGSAPGDSLDLAKPLQTTGNIWYVSSLIGTDAASPAGQNREKPLATIGQAVTNAVDGDIIVFLAGHAQTLTAPQSIAKAITLIGEGTTNGKPAVSLILNAAAGALLTISVAFVELRNIYFPPNQQTNASARVNITGTDCAVTGCYFECGATDTGAGLTFASASRMRLEGNTFISVATSTAAQPLSAIRSAGTTVGLVMKNNVVSAGTVGFSTFSAINFSGGTISSLVIEGLSLLLGADADLGAGTVTGRVNVQLSTGGSRVAWS